MSGQRYSAEWFAALREDISKRKSELSKFPVHLVVRVRELWWEFDPIGLGEPCASFVDEYDDYVYRTVVAFRDGTDVRLVIAEALENMSLRKRVDADRIERFVKRLNEFSCEIHENGEFGGSSN